MPPRLPAALEDVLIPALFAPTAIASAGGCRLRMVVASSSRTWPSLSAGPMAELGTLGHRVLERHARGHSEPASVFELCARESFERLNSDPSTASYADLPLVVGLAHWSRFRADVFSRCGATPIPSRAGHPASTFISSHVGREKTITSSELRLKGRPDFTQRVGEGSEVRDYKTGRIRDAGGEVKSEIVFQLWCYGLLVLERDPTTAVRLVVDDGAEHEIPFGPVERKRARRALARALRGLTPGRRFLADELASPGETCVDCTFRHRCSAYRRMAPVWWRLGLETPRELARDVWGTITDVREEVTGLLTVVVKDATQRKVRIDRLARRHEVDDTLVGRDIWMFDLESTVSRRASDGRRLQPTTFHELPADSSQRRAWCLRVHV